MARPFHLQLMLICAASAAWAFSFGLGTQAVSHWLHHHDASNTVIGLSHTVYYLGLALTSLAAPRLVNAFGARTAACGMLLAGLTLAAFPWGGGLPGCFALRFLNGGAGALSVIPLEALVSSRSSAATRTRDFACYAVALTLGGAAGIGVGLAWYEPGGVLAFYVGAAFPAAASAVLWLKVAEPIAQEEGDAAARLDWRRHFLSFGTAWYQGFLEGGMLAFLSLYLVGVGFSTEAAGLLMGATMVGVVLFQVPAGWLADRVGPTPMLLICYAVVALGLAAIPWLTGGVALAGCLFLFGAFSGAMYPLGLSLLGGQGGAGQLARAYAWYLALECVGSQLGAAAMGRARDVWGEGAMFAVGLGTLAAVLSGWAVFRRREPAPVPGNRELGRRAA